MRNSKKFFAIVVLVGLSNTYTSFGQGTLSDQSINPQTAWNQNEAKKVQKAATEALKKIPLSKINAIKDNEQKAYVLKIYNHLQKIAREAKNWTSNEAQSVYNETFKLTLQVPPIAIGEDDHILFEKENNVTFRQPASNSDACNFCSSPAPYQSAAFKCRNDLKCCLFDSGCYDYDSSTGYCIQKRWCGFLCAILWEACIVGSIFDLAIPITNKDGIKGGIKKRP
jgi:hypothetical protein